MKEKLKEYALLAEILGGAAVVVTLIFLVVETRENTNAIQAQTYQALTAELNANRRNAGSLELAEIRQKQRDDGLDSLTPVEQYRFMSLRQALWGTYESAYYARERGILGESEWNRFISAICRNFAAEQELWDRPGQSSIGGNITAEFREFTENSCQ